MTTPDIDTALGWRGRTVIDREGRKVGRLDALYLDAETDRPAWAAVHTGLFGLRRSFVPLAGSVLVGDDVQVPFTEEVIKDAPKADPDVTLSEEEEALLYRHYGVIDERSTTLGVGDTDRRAADADEGRIEGSHDDAPVAPDRTDDRPAPDRHAEPGRGAAADVGDDAGPDRRADAGTTRAPEGDEEEGGLSVIRSEEQVHIGKREARSRLRLKRYVVTDEEVVPVRREEVRVERVPEGDDRDAEVVFDSGEPDPR